MSILFGESHTAASSMAKYKRLQHTAFLSSSHNPNYFHLTPLFPVGADACKDLLAAMLAVDPAKRSKIEDIRANPWLTQVRNVTTLLHSCAPLSD